MTHFSMRPRFLSYCVCASSKNKDRHHQKDKPAKEQQKQSWGLSIISTSERHFIQYHFPFRVHAHSDVDELLVEERHADLQAPRRRRLVGTQAVVLVQGFHLRKRSRGGSRRDQNRPESKRNRHARACRGGGGGGGVPCGRSPCGTPPCWERSGSRGSRRGARRSPHRTAPSSPPAT